ncbi:polysaccharide biosynthesis tyrosine autokinase [Pseudobacter ginsenosidimutans]|nr:polysaccharide biosynthesis tyrosine autokinase [Pseudobacter ginsenosidimutans]
MLSLLMAVYSGAGHFLVLQLAVFAVYSPTYSVSASLLIKSDGGRGGNQDMFSDLLLYKESTNKQNEVEILKSRTMMMRVVRTLNLQCSYYVVGNVKTPNIYKDSPFELQLIPPFDSARSMTLEVHKVGKDVFRLGENQKEYHFGEIITVGERKVMLVQRESRYSSEEYQDFIVKWQPVEQAALSVLGRLEVTGTADLSNVLKLTYVTENPRLGADIINTLMNEYSETGVEDKNQTNRKIISFIDDRLRFVEIQLDSVEKDLQLFKTNRQVIDLSTQSNVYFNNLNEMTKGIQQQELQFQVIELVENYLRDSTHNLSLVPSTLGLEDKTLSDLTSNYNQLLVSRSTELQTGATINSPVIKAIDRNIDDARQKLLRNLVNIKTVYRNAITAMQSQNKDYQSQLASIPEKERESREKARQQEIKQNLYLYLLQKKEESGIAQASVIPDSRVIDEALNSGALVSPNSVRIYLIALLIGLMIPVVIIYSIELLNDKVTTRSDITKITDVPIVAEVGHSNEKNVLLFPGNSRTVVAEQIRILRSNLRFLFLDRPKQNTILVTSSFSGEGKSFISINLGAAMALSGKKTVILEFDLRKPKIVEGLGLPKGQGLTNYLIGSSNLAQLPQAVPSIENLYVIPSGPIPPNPSEILLSEKMSELFNWLHENFDVVVIDTAPVGLVSDSMSLGQYADATLYLVRQRYTHKKQLQFIQELYIKKSLPNIGLVINDVISKGAKSYYGYGGGRYGYGYGYGYGAHNGYYEDHNSEYWGKLKRMFSKKK